MFPTKIKRIETKEPSDVGRRCFPWPCGEVMVICSCIGFKAETSNMNSENILAFRNPREGVPHPHSSLSTSTAYCQITPVLLFFSGGGGLTLTENTFMPVYNKKLTRKFTNESAKLPK